MKKIYIYMAVCMLLGTLMAFKTKLAMLFSENLDQPTPADLIWKLPKHTIYSKKITLQLQTLKSDDPVMTITSILHTLRQKNLGIKKLILSGSRKMPTNVYLRALSKEDWGIEEIHLHTTEAIHIYAFMNLLKSTSRSLNKVMIWNNRWDSETLHRTRSLLPKSIPFELYVY